MPAVPVYSASPVNAAKASGTSPQTAQPEQKGPASEAPATTTSESSQQGYPSPQPAARPSLPVQTGAPQPPTNIQPTPTSQNIQDAGPPVPQPGAVPVPPSSGASHLPPPPKAGETLQQSHQTATMPMPPQISYPAPTSRFPAWSSTATAPPPTALGGAKPTSVREGGLGDAYTHPPGYRQDVHASEFNSTQRAAHDASVSHNYQAFGGGGDDESVWGTAKKWASAAGNSLAAAENEVWKRINKE